ncbi:molybdate ABC transporter substrate-binding protein [Sneathiella sp. P13V-1]|uniref:molybdate ABC transporter substrate-binding protein n=1 Tax=Sneathiella sp. P13V-1 TaxID=2697366 RepID=UPI00187B359B|nr:molybdate ABC transporter substrate-binding protein [Sneathiella sp. P13V-1]MBE7638213.1 molybdate ABC transporter substrate-binding protein [Sneathiella sp. P13V-1]
MSLMAKQIYCFLFSLVIIGGPAFSAKAETTTVSVASNFITTAEKLVVMFEEQFDHKVKLASGSSGKIVTQILHGAPFDLFLAADFSHPIKLIENGMARREDLFTYAVGRLALFSSQIDKELEQGTAPLSSSNIKRIAVANPRLAPYGQAAFEYMQATNVLAATKDKLVYGNNVAQTYQFIATGNANIGFVALSQVLNVQKGSYWLVPQKYHAPLKQAAILTLKGTRNQAARDFYAFLKSEVARALIRQQGYDISEEG